MNLRDYQVAAVGAVLEHLRRYRSTAIAMPTGSGKTVVFCEVARRLNRRTLILAHREELLTQAAEKLAYAGITAAIEQAESRASPDHQFVVGSVQSLQRQRLRRFSNDHFGLIIIDECHHAPAQSYRNVLDHFASAQVLGVSATFQRLDELGYEGIFDSIAFELSMKELVTAGYLCSIKAKTLPIKIDLRKVRKVAGDYIKASWPGPSARNSTEPRMPSQSTFATVERWHSYPASRTLKYSPDSAEIAESTPIS